MKEHPEDICECGMYRHCHPRQKCQDFKLVYSYWENYDIYDDCYEVEPDLEEREQ